MLLILAILSTLGTLAFGFIMAMAQGMSDSPYTPEGYWTPFYISVAFAFAMWVLWWFLGGKPMTW
jgi:hypothetical protein